jgi:hypothetical protein
MSIVRSEYIVHFNPIVGMYAIVHNDLLDSYFASNFELSNFEMTFCSSLRDVNRWFKKLEKECMV